MSKLAPIHNPSTGITFNMRLVARGERYGRNMSLVHEKVIPLIEFYDSRYPHDAAPDGTPLGQFVSRYNFDTLVECGLPWGLTLDGGVSEWRLDRHATALVSAILDRWMMDW